MFLCFFNSLSKYRDLDIIHVLYLSINSLLLYEHGYIQVQIMRF